MNTVVTRGVLSRGLFCLVLLLGLLQAAPSWAQAGTNVLLGITVEGNLATDENLIRINSGLVNGQSLTGEDIQHAIRQLWSLERFSNVEIQIARELPEGLYLLIQVEEKPLLAGIEILGNKKLKKLKLSDTLKDVVTTGKPIGEAEVFRVRKTLLDLYQGEGYEQAEVEATLRDVQDSRGTLYVVISEGRRTRIREVVFHGNQAFSERRLARQMKKTRTKGFLRKGEFDPAAFEEDQKNLVDFLRKQGYRDARVERDSVSFNDDGKALRVDVWVYEGRQYTFGDVSFTGNTVYPGEFLGNQLLFKPGDTYNEQKYQRSLESLQDLYYNRGYIQVRVDPIEEPRGESVVDIRFQITENNIFSVRRVEFAGNDKTKEKVLRREMSLHPGDTFDVGRLRRSLRDITILNYFDKVEPNVDIAGSDQVDLTVSVSEKTTDQISMSAGYSERDKLVGSLGFTLNNLMGNGQKLTLDWQFAKSYRSIRMDFEEPWLFDRPVLAGISLYDTYNNRTTSDGFNRRIRGGSLSLGKRLNWPDNYFQARSTYALEEVVYTDFIESERESLIERGFKEDDPELSSTMALVLQRDSRDHPEFPTTGSTLRLQSKFGGGYLGGSYDFQKYTMSMRSYSPFFGKFVFYNSMETGVVDGLSANDEIPWYERFFMGGTALSVGTSLRGYNERDVGTGDDGGRTMVKLGSEVRVQLIPSPTVYGLVFGEAGNVWKNVSSASLNDLARSAGIGMRLHMPLVGLIGLDYAYGFDRLNGSTGLREGQWEFHFQFGREF
ncbi:MAG: outer membrane protein assembly factor BamA [Calditrichaeota bacterium]|nr:outer membrane protein assembly factor BamA [Candidatus Cloacimonadota bacterium]MCA9785957.1 outer membrane protein assembly factor BamA [Candidatus Cloacimonadota bacterium]MCB1045632.1 outer membrane protein assembly factor BamA [Calditrichota bacterium]MCB9474614.1 outer membrane protein assembly factor BamA [Candidatus Delongbacteria bacterium]